MFFSSYFQVFIIFKMIRLPQSSIKRDLRIINPPVLLLSDPVCVPAHPELSRPVGGAGCGVPRPRLRHHRDLRPQLGRGAGGGRCCSSQGSPGGEAGCAALSGRQSRVKFTIAIIPFFRFHNVELWSIAECCVIVMVAACVF